MINSVVTRYAALAVIIGGSGICACGGNSSEDGVTCGAGTVAASGSCVPEDAGLEPDAASGGMPGDASLSDQQNPGDDAGGSTVDAPSDAIAADSGALDDACPTTPLYLNCDDECRGPSPECYAPGSRVTCSGGATTAAVYDHAAFPLVVRTPSHPGVDQKCIGECGESNTVFGVSLYVGVPDGSVYALRVTAPEPWRVRFSKFADFCLDGASAGCSVYDYGTSIAVEIVTDDPNAPARNVLLERVPKPAICP